MADKLSIGDEMDVAADGALKQLDTLIREATEEELSGVSMIVDWIREHKDKAGYKRLCKGLLARADLFPTH